jgi:hypothetical protein
MGEVTFVDDFSKVDVTLLEIEQLVFQLNMQVLGTISFEQDNPVLVGGGASTLQQEVHYFPLPEDTRQCELIITGQIPPDIRFYRKAVDDENQAKFGSISVAYAGVTGGYSTAGFHQWAWTRRTILDCYPKLRNDRFVRVFLKAGLSFVVYDTGLREVVKTSQGGQTEE